LKSSQGKLQEYEKWGIPFKKFKVTLL